ncbi:MAG TPA: PIG-L family deacetylase [Actinomycetes bacterium]|nr:PIG-L family deacetylase [Actinomycetes bacterium]
MVVFHAHPDDESLLTAGTMARAAAAGHRVVLVVATAGEAGLASSDLVVDGRLGQRRLRELHRSAAALGVARVEVLGYGDSGLAPDVERPVVSEAFAGRTLFAHADVEEAAARLAEILCEEQADVLTSYDANGGYGHPDHVQVHRVGLRAAALAKTPALLEATVDRDLLLRGLALASKVHRFPPEFDFASFQQAYVPRTAITHRVDVRRYARAKRASMAAHASQATADGGDRTLAALLRLPQPVFRWVLGREWFTQVRPAVPSGSRLLRDPFAAVGTSRRRGPRPG